MKKILLYLWFSGCVLSINAQYEFGVRDSIRDLRMSGGTNRSSPYKCTYGIRVFPQNTDSATTSKIVVDNDIYYIMIPDLSLQFKNLGLPEELYVFANLDINDFSLGGPYINLTDSAIFEKYDGAKGTRLAPDNAEDLNEEDSDCPPYEFVVFTKDDTISYARSKHFGPYDMYFEARLSGNKYHFGEYCVGNDIRKTKIGKRLPTSILDNYHVIRVINYKNYFLYGMEQEPEYQIEVVLYLDGYAIKRMTIEFH